MLQYHLGGFSTACSLVRAVHEEILPLSHMFPVQLSPIPSTYSPGPYSQPDSITPLL